MRARLFFSILPVLIPYLDYKLLQDPHEDLSHHGLIELHLEFDLDQRVLRGFNNNLELDPYVKRVDIAEEMIIRPEYLRHSALRR
jgi:hypothetical protein